MSSSVTTPSVRELEARLAEHMTERHFLDMLTDTEHWLHWTSPFGPIAERLQTNQETIRRWLGAGELRGMQLGDRSGYRVPVSELRRFIAAHESPAQGRTTRGGRGVSLDTCTATASPRVPTCTGTGPVSVPEPRRRRRLPLDLA